MSAVVRPRFYPLISFALVAVVLVGFSRTYYLRLFSGPLPLTTLVHVHAALFTAWLALFVAQVLLVAAHRVDLHRKLGIASAVFAVLVIAVGILTVLQSATSNRVSPSGLAPPQFSIIGFTSIGMFAVFLTLGVAFRRRPGLHRRFMILAMVAATSPATSRLLRIFDVQHHRDALIPGLAALFIVACLVHDWRKYRIVHPVYVIGGLVIVASWPLRLMIGHSAWYFPIGEGVARIARTIF